MESMNLFENDSAAPKDNLIHYQGELGDFWYDPNEFEIEHTKNDTLHYKGNDLSVSLSEGYIDTRGVFEGCELPEGFTLGDKFDTSNVINMDSMFAECSLKGNIFVGDKFDTSNVENMNHMFMNSDAAAVIIGDKFDTSKVTSMEGVFSNCKLPEGFSLGEQFDISKLHEYLKGSR